MASGMNFAYYVLYRFWINPLSHKFLIGTIELYRGQGKIWKQVRIFFPVMEPRIHIFLHIHLAWHKGNSLTAFFQLSLLLHGRNIILSLFYFPTDQKQFRDTLVLFPLWAWNRLQRKKKLKQTKKEINCKEVKFSTQLFHLVYVLSGSECILYWPHIFSMDLV